MERSNRHWRCSWSSHPIYVFPQERVRDTLRFMGRPADERVTARPEWHHQDHWTQYGVDVDTINCQSRGSLAREQIQADKKKRVLGAFSTH